MSYRRPDINSMPTEPEQPQAKVVHTECIVLLQRALRDLHVKDGPGQMTMQLIRAYLQELRKRP